MEDATQKTEPFFVRPKEGARMAGCGLTKFHELMASGIIKSRKVHGMRLVEVASIKTLGTAE